MRIVLTNDDGIQSAGLWALYHALKPDHQLTVVAPERERSAVGHGITLHKPLRAHEVVVDGQVGWAVTGTPADCVKLTLVELLDDKPDMVISGINPGANVGVNLNYSGTVAAAKEGAIYGVPAMAVSIQSAQNPCFDEAARFVARLVTRVQDHGLPSGVFLNVNFPNLFCDRTAAVKIARQGCTLYDEFFEKRRDPRNRIYYWHGYETMPAHDGSDADAALLAAEYIVITPVRCDMTDYGMIEKMKSWDFNF
ncbi:MAG: 5'/3'-nucleotidase SurE [Desulfobacteraceae bacterium]|nr:MAG: 5'/3'-nucleotidase SurE [Desulfobacteraceae bacterium]